MPQAHTSITPAETKELGEYAIRRSDRSDEVKSKFYRHMLEKRWSLSNFNPFELYKPASRRSKSKPDREKSSRQKRTPSQENLSKLQQVTKESQEIIYSAKSVFPFTLFPDSIIIDRHKLSIVYRYFFLVEQTVSVPLSDIKNIQASMGPFFGSVIVTSDTFINNTQTVKFLWRKDVTCIQELVQGAMMAHKEEIDISKVPPKKLYNLLLNLGRGHSGATA